MDVNNKGDYCRVHFRVLCASKPGQSIGVCGIVSAGSAPTVTTSTGAILGEDSSFSTAIKLVTTPESYPIWYTAAPIVLPCGELVQYKYCLIESGNVKAVEKIPTPRLLIPDEPDLVIEDEFYTLGLERSKLFDLELDIGYPNSAGGSGSAGLGTPRSYGSPKASPRNYRPTFASPTSAGGSGTGSGSGSASTSHNAGRDSLAAISHSNKRRASEASVMEKQHDFLRMAQRNSRLFLICYHLPVNIKRTNKPNEPFEASWAESLIAKTQGSVSGSIKTIWIGTVNMSVRDLTAEEKEYLRTMLANMDCIPVFIDDEITSMAYFGFCKSVMWPVFHNVDQLDQIHAAWNLPAEYEMLSQKLYSGLSERFAAENSRGGRSRSTTADWTFAASSAANPENKVLEWNHQARDFHEAFQEVNRIFAETVMSHVRDGDIAWIHDYHLMLVPQLIRNHLTAMATATGGLCSSTPNSANVAAGETSPGRTSGASSLVNPGVPYPGCMVKELKIIFFLHIPFPTSQIFRTLPESTELIESMVCADLVGFHAFDHARHFLNAAKRMLGIKSYTKPGGMLILGVQDREVIITMSHVSIETDRMDLSLQNPDTKRLCAEYSSKYAGMRVIVGIDVCQRLSGVALKLAGFEKFALDYLSSERSTSTGVVLVQRVIRQGSRPEDEETTANDMRKMVAEFNAKFSGKRPNHFGGSNTNSGTNSPIGGGGGVFIDYAEVASYKGISKSERLALYQAADVFLLTPIREGLNLYPLEYIYSRKDLPRAGVVIVSEFSTCSSLLNGSLKINPFSPVSIADAIEKALSMSNRECEYRRQRDMPFIQSHPSSLWTKQILNELEQLNSKIGHGRVLVSKLAEPLNQGYILRAYQHAAWDSGICKTGTRVFIFDYGGALLHKERFDIYMKQTLSAIAGRRPSQTMMEAVQRLSADPLNAILVITGITRMKFGQTFKDLKNVAIATSNGLIYSWGDMLAMRQPNQHRNSSPQSSDDGREWECMDCNIDWNAVSEIASPIITKFTFRTNGTCKTPRFPGIGWSYFGADPEWGRKQAAQLKLELEAALANYDVKIMSLVPGSIEVVPRALKKGLIVSKFLQRIVAMRGGRLPGMITVLGAEETDDGMTQSVFNMVRDSPSQAELRRLKTFTIAVGKRESSAQFYLNDISDVERLLNSFNNCVVEREGESDGTVPMMIEPGSNASGNDEEVTEDPRGPYFRQAFHQTASSLPIPIPGAIKIGAVPPIPPSPVNMRQPTGFHSHNIPTMPSPAQRALNSKSQDDDDGQPMETEDDEGITI